jgi:hypothetical protein
MVLSETAQKLLSADAQRPDRLIEFPPKFPAAARNAVIRSLLKRNLAAEVAASAEQRSMAWRQHEGVGWWSGYPIPAFRQSRRCCRWVAAVRIARLARTTAPGQTIQVLSRRRVLSTARQPRQPQGTPRPQQWPALCRMCWPSSSSAADYCNLERTVPAEAKCRDFRARRSEGPYQNELLRPG